MTEGGRPPRERLSQPWVALALDLQSAAGNPQAMVGRRRASIISISVIVDEKGNPIGWTFPTKAALEPHRMTRQLLESIGVG
jgi:hypothetical protein